jgi:hypothetical protein
MEDINYKINPALGEEDKEQVLAIQKGVQLQVELNRLKGAPIARFDMKAKKPYLEYPDGRRDYENGY